MVNSPSKADVTINQEYLPELRNTNTPDHIQQEENESEKSIGTVDVNLVKKCAQDGEEKNIDGGLKSTLLTPFLS